MRSALLGDRSFYRNVLLIALPVALQNLLGTTASMVDTVMLGTQGELAVAAVGICAQFSSLLFAAYFGFANGGMLFFAQYWGAKNEEGICRAYGVALACMMAVGLAFGVASVFFPEFVLQIYTDKPAIREIGVSYLRITGISFPLQVLAMAVSSLLRSTERVKIPLYASIAALLTNLLVNWLLIFGRFGLPALGARGAAVGTVAAGAVNVAVLYALAMRDRNQFLLQVRRHFQWTREFLRHYFVKCCPIILNELLYGVGQMLINIVVGRQSEASIAAMAVFRVIEGLIFAFFGGLANASSLIVGKQVGAGAHASAHRDAGRFAILCPLVTLCICLLILPVRAPLLRALGLGEEAMAYGMAMLVIYLVFGTVRTCNYMMNSTFRAGGEPAFAALIEIGFLFLVAVPATWLSGMVWRLPFLLVFCMMYLDEFIRLFIQIWYLRSGRWIHPVTQEGVATLEAFRLSLKKNARGAA